MPVNNLSNQTLALAANFQYLEQVYLIATQGQYDSAVLENAVHAITQLEAHDVEEIFGGKHHFRRGMQLVKQQLGSASKGNNIDITRYFMTLLRLESLLMNNKQAFEQLRRGLETVVSQAQYFESTHDTVIANIADQYQSVISPLGTKVIVNGDQSNLRNEQNAKLIRVFLMAALRSVVLWRQCGGSKLKLVFNRSKFIQNADEYLKLT